MGPKKRTSRSSKKKVEAEEAVPEVEQEDTQPMEEDGSDNSAALDTHVEEQEDSNEATGAEVGDENEEDDEEPPQKKSKPDQVSDSTAAAESEFYKSMEADEESAEAAEEEKPPEMTEEEKEREAERIQKEKEEAEKKAAQEKEEAARKAKQAKEEAERKAKIEKEEKEKADKKKELDKYWKAVKDDPADFTGWTYLLQFVDNKNLLEEGRKAYDAFLTRYPYCYGYWKKYADFEKRHSTPEMVQAIFSRGMKAIPLSVDLWLHYINYVKTADQSKDDIEYITQQYDRAVEACGKDFKSDKLWDSYIKFQLEQKNMIKTYHVFERCLKIPTMGLVENFDKFRDFVKSNHPKELMDSGDFLNFRKEILESMKEDKKEDSETEALETGEDKEQDEQAPGADGAEFEGSEKEITAMKEHLIFSMKKIFKETDKIFNARLKFESKIKRPYFHVKPLERSALVTWNEYLDYMKKSIPEQAPKGFKKEISCSVDDLKIIYQRCLIPCALYEEFWLSYINWLETLEGDNIETIREVYTQACTSHLQNKINIHLRWAMFEEINQNMEAAAQVLEKLEQQHPELTSVKLRRVNLERRRGDHDKATNLYEACVEATQEDVLNADCSIKFARYLRLHRQDNTRAKEVLDKAIELHPDNIKLYLQKLDLLLHIVPVDVSEVVTFFNKSLQVDFKASQKLVLSQRKLEFIEDFGVDAEELKKNQEEHAKLSKELKSKIAEEEGKEQNLASAAQTQQKDDPWKPVSNTNDNSNKFSSYPPTGNSASYGAHQNMAYQNNAARYGTYPQGNYQMQYGQGYTGY